MLWSTIGSNQPNYTSSHPLVSGNVLFWGMEVPKVQGSYLWHFEFSSLLFSCGEGFINILANHLFFFYTQYDDIIVHVKIQERHYILKTEHYIFKTKRPYLTGKNELTHPL